MLLRDQECTVHFSSGCLTHGCTLYIEHPSSLPLCGMYRPASYEIVQWLTQWALDCDWLLDSITQTIIKRQGKNPKCLKHLSTIFLINIS